MKAFASLATAATLAFTGSAALAQGPVQMTDEQLDSTAAGLITVIAVDVVDINNNQVQVAVPVTAAVTAQVGILSQQFALTEATQVGRIGQRR
jgi:hypothetical protein